MLTDTRQHNVSSSASRRVQPNVIPSEAQFILKGKEANASTYETLHAVNSGHQFVTNILERMFQQKFYKASMNRAR